MLKEYITILLTIWSVLLFLIGMIFNLLYAVLTLKLGEENVSDPIKLLKQIRTFIIGTMIMIMGIGLKLFFG